MKIAFYSSKRERCGISTYTDHLAAAMMKLGHKVAYYKCQLPFEDSFKPALEARPDVFHFQHEPSIMPPDEISVRFANQLRAQGTKVFVTLHTENSGTVASGKAIAGSPAKIIMHRPSLMIDSNILPMPCPVLEPIPDRKILRQKYGFPDNAFIVSTVGFLITWKEHARIAEQMLPWIKDNRDMHLQIIASQHFNQDLVAFAKQETEQLLRHTQAIGKRRLRHVSHYPTDQELIERLVISNLGYVWCPMHTGSSSAAAAMFTTARCPLVATTSTHYAYLGESNILRASKDDVVAFVKTIQNTADNPGILSLMKEAQQEIYKERNYLATAAKHVEIYEKEAL